MKLSCPWEVQREFPGKIESKNLSRDNLSREIGRTIGRGNPGAQRMGAGALGCSGMWCFRMWGFKLLVLNPSPISALGVKSPHLSVAEG